MVPTPPKFNDENISYQSYSYLSRMVEALNYEIQVLSDTVSSLRAEIEALKGEKN